MGKVLIGGGGMEYTGNVWEMKWSEQEALQEGILRGCMCCQNIRGKAAAQLYEKLGYRTVKHERFSVENGVILVYEIMEKILTGFTR